MLYQTKEPDPDVYRGVCYLFLFKPVQYVRVEFLHVYKHNVLFFIH